MEHLDEKLLDAGVILCIVMILVLFFRVKTRGKSAYVMASAFAIMAALLYGMSHRWSAFWLNSLSILLGISLVLDLLIRLIEQSKNND